MRLLSQKPIRTQLSVLLVVASLFLVAVAGIGVARLREGESFARHTNDQNMPRQKLGSTLLKAIGARGLASSNMALTTVTAERDQQLVNAQKAEDEIQTALKALKVLTEHAAPEEIRLIESMLEAEAAYSPVGKAILQVIVDGDPLKAGAMLIEEGSPLQARLEKSVDMLLQYVEADAQEDLTVQIASAGRAIVWLAALGLAALALLVWLGYAITRGLVASSQQALSAVEKMAAGDMSLRIDSPGNSEPQRVLRSLDSMAARLREVLGSVREATDQIAIASDEVARGAQDLSARTEQAASSLEETAASMEEMTVTVQQSSGSARQANQLAEQSASVAGKGGEMVSRIVTTMGEIQRGSSRIGEIIGVIDGIAFQTNILALNAAVEAARAGEQGRGFAVVAGEVRNLAQRSAQAAREIKQLIEAANAQVADGTRLVQDAGGTITEVVENARRVSGIVGEIMASSTEQADGVAQINVAVGQLDHMTQQNAALVEQTSAAADSLKDQARHLAAAVAVFRFDERGEAPALQHA